MAARSSGSTAAELTHRRRRTPSASIASRRERAPGGVERRGVDPGRAWRPRPPAPRPARRSPRGARPDRGGRPARPGHRAGRCPPARGAARGPSPRDPASRPCRTSSRPSLPAAPMMRSFMSTLGPYRLAEPAAARRGSRLCPRPVRALDPQAPRHDAPASCGKARKSCGKPISTALASSSRMRWSSPMVASRAPRLSSSCSRVRAPMMGAVTLGFRSVPGQRDLRGRAVELDRYRLDHVGDAQGALGERAVARRHVTVACPRPPCPPRGHRGRRARTCPSGPRSPAATSPPPPMPISRAHRDQVALHGALDEAVLYLERHQRRPAAQVRDGLHPRGLPGRQVRDAAIEDLAGPARGRPSRAGSPRPAWWRPQACR